MAYTKTTWVNNNTPAINAENLNKIEDGIFNVHQDVTNLDTRVSTNEDDVVTLTNSVTTIENAVTAIENDSDWVLVNTATSLLAGDNVFVLTSITPVDVTLPESPSIGDTVRICDASGNFGVAPCNVLRNGTSNENIMGLADDLVLDTNNQSVELVYSGNSTYGWRVTARA